MSKMVTSCFFDLVHVLESGLSLFLKKYALSLLAFIIGNLLVFLEKTPNIEVL